ncbi:MAG: aminotransferase class V-fold PLP-dependent enzyme [Gemmatimonadetes bacterium]|nr:aminotransferase class V-fold PLP-dependent enzyme [Gemmatimonadota bacterium]
MTRTTASRRDFLRTVGVSSAAAMLAPAPLAAEPTAPRIASSTRAPTGTTRAPRGLALAPDDFLFEPGLTYLQTGSLGPTPRPVMERTIGAWTTLESNPAAQGYGPLEHAIEAVRAKAAAFLGCKTDEMVLTNCTTEGMNWVAQGLGLAAGDHVLTTDQEHPGDASAGTMSRASTASCSTSSRFHRAKMMRRPSSIAFAPRSPRARASSPSRTCSAPPGFACRSPDSRRSRASAGASPWSMARRPPGRSR